MTLIEEVQSFARDYINRKEYRTSDRKIKIRKALSSLTGKNINSGCSTCYIEALFEIIKITKMATSKYELKKGVVLQAFGHPEKTCTNNTITDELGDWYMKNHPEKRIYFARYPQSAVSTPHPAMTIVQPKKSFQSAPNIVKPDPIVVPDPPVVDPPEPEAIINEALTGEAPKPRRRNTKSKK